MAPIGDRNLGGSTFEENSKDEDANDLWAQTLSEVQTSSDHKLPSNRLLLVLGDDGSGKTALIAKLQGTEDPRQGNGLEYHYIDVKDEYRDDQTRLGVWVLDGDSHHTGLLKFALNERTFENSLVLLVVSMSNPWNVMDALKRWTSVIRDHCDLLRISPEQMNEYEQSLVRHFQDYVAPSEEQKETTSHTRKPNPLHPQAQPDDDRVLLPLGETTLTHNLGIPIVVVVTKSDTISTLEKEHDYREEHFDFIQMHIRKFCLNYGASLFYTSVKEDKNIDLLQRYILHRVYGLPYHTPALVVERDAVFIPAGWDNEKKIAILYESMTSFSAEANFEEVIVKPSMRKPIMRDLEVMAEDEQAFLMKQQMQLSKNLPAGPQRQDSTGMRAPSGTPKPSQRQASTGSSPGGIAAGPKKMDPNRPGGANSEGVLANFFNSLLSKKAGAPGTPGVPGQPGTQRADKVAATRDAAAELDRMTRSGKKPIQTQSSAPAPQTGDAS